MKYLSIIRMQFIYKPILYILFTYTIVFIFLYIIIIIVIIVVVARQELIISAKRYLLGI